MSLTKIYQCALFAILSIGLLRCDSGRSPTKPQMGPNQPKSIVQSDTKTGTGTEIGLGHENLKGQGDLTRKTQTDSNLAQGVCVTADFIYGKIASCKPQTKSACLNAPINKSFPQKYFEDGDCSSKYKVGATLENKDNPPSQGVCVTANYITGIIDSCESKDQQKCFSGTINRSNPPQYFTDATCDDKYKVGGYLYPIEADQNGACVLANFITQEIVSCTITTESACTSGTMNRTETPHFIKGDDCSGDLAVGNILPP